MNKKFSIVNKSFFDNKELINTLHKTILIEVTKRCHRYSKEKNEMECKHCFVASLQEDISWKVLTRSVEYSKKHFYTIGIGGGEPFLAFDKIKYIIENARENLINIFTSAEIITNKQIEYLKLQDNVVLSISLNGNEERHNYLSNKNNYKKIVSVIKKLNDNKIPWIRKTVANSNNIDYILSDNYEKDSFDLGCIAIDVGRYYPMGPKSDNTLKISYDNYIKLDKKLKKLSVEGMAIYPENDKKCRSLPYINIFGNISPCAFVPPISLNILKIDSTEFYKNIKELQKDWMDINDSPFFCNLLKDYF